MKVASAAMKLSNLGKKEPGEQMALAEEVLALDPFHAKANQIIGDAGATLGYPVFKAFAYETLAKGKPNDKQILNKLAADLHGDQGIRQGREDLPADSRHRSARRRGAERPEECQRGPRPGPRRLERGGRLPHPLKNKGESELLEAQSKIVKSQEAIDEQIAANYAKHQADPANGAISKAIAQLFVQKNDYGSAIPFYVHAFEAGNRVDSALEKIIGDLKLKHADQELMALTAALAEKTDPEEQQQYQTAIEQKKSELDMVRLEQAEARVRSHPNDGQFHFELGEALYKVGQYKRALSELQQGLKQPSVRYQALNLMGLSFLQQGMLDLAIKRFSDAQSELPAMDDLKKEITYNLGLAQERNGDATSALDQFKKIYEVDMAYRDVAARVESSYGT